MIKGALWLGGFILFTSGMGAQDLSGRWVYTEGQQTAELVLRHDTGTGRITGTFSLLGVDLPVEGRADRASFTLEQMGGVPLAGQGRSVTGRLQQDTLAVQIANPGEDAIVMRMRRAGRAPSGAAGEAAPRVQSAPPRAGGAQAGDVGGKWEAANDDKTSFEIVEITVSGNNVQGAVQEFERGYFSGRVTLKRTYQLRGTMQGATAAVRVWDAQGSETAGGNATLERRGEYLVIRVGSHESPYARPGVPLVRSAEGSPEAARLAQAIAGRVYQTGSQAHGRGASVGGRMKVAFCSDSSIQYDASNLASTGAIHDQTIDLGSTVTRRGVWRMVLRGGKPVVRAEWQGTGTSYSLTDYFVVTPGQDGRSAVINGVELPLAGGC